eukprot:TRINITY_DN7640_c0_g1_i4.p1 TRINITY_DN7640_c0_g1~~TRINITY_DN7640_c0_g1_i4.p1  ORF type:complete len:184 (+),score=30.39 TRINITY_DN7640_c0_g1_i4:909-1460(+)
MTIDIWNISHTDPNPQPSFFDEDYQGDIIVPDTPIATNPDSTMEEEMPTTETTEEPLPQDDNEQATNDVPKLASSKKKRVSKPVHLLWKVKVPERPSLPTNKKVKTINNSKNILSAVYTIMQKPAPPVFDVTPSSLASKVDHLRHLFAFLPLSKFREIVLQYLPSFTFDKHGPDIEQAFPNHK